MRKIGGLKSDDIFESVFALNFMNVGHFFVQINGWNS
jgi:hypothetical protein